MLYGWQNGKNENVIFAAAKYKKLQLIAAFYIDNSLQVTVKELLDYKIQKLREYPQLQL